MQLHGQNFVQHQKVGYHHVVNNAQYQTTFVTATHASSTIPALWTTQKPGPTTHHTNVETNVVEERERNTAAAAEGAVKPATKTTVQDVKQIIRMESHMTQEHQKER